MGERWLVTRLLIVFIKHTKMCGRLATHRTKPSYPVLNKKKKPLPAVPYVSLLS